MKDLIYICMEAQRKYTLKKIYNINERRAFNAGFSRAEQVIIENIDHTSYTGTILNKLHRYVQNSNSIVFSKALFSNPHRYYVLAFEQSIDIVLSLTKRFVTGDNGDSFVERLNKCL